MEPRNLNPKLETLNPQKAEIPEYLQVDLEALEKAMEAHPEHAEGQQVTFRNLMHRDPPMTLRD